MPSKVFLAIAVMLAGFAAFWFGVQLGNYSAPWFRQQSAAPKLQPTLMLLGRYGVYDTNINGTRCIIVYESMGNAISCDWSKQ